MAAKDATKTFEDYIAGKWKKFSASLACMNKDVVYHIHELQKTDLGGGKILKTMVPQGVTVTDKYVLISAYDGGSKENSVIYVKDKNSGKSLVQINLGIHCHVGAIAYSPKTKKIFIADSAKKGVWLLPVATIDGFVKAKKTAATVKMDKETDFFACKVNPSYLTYFDGKVFIGNHNPEEAKENYALAYEETEKGYKQTKIKLQLPLKSQGMCFVKDGKSIYMVASASLGRENPGSLFIYQVTLTKDDAWAKTKVIGQLVVPNMCEDIAFAGTDDIMVCFESAARKYYAEDMEKIGKTIFPLDRIIVYSWKKILKSIK